MSSTALRVLMCCSRPPYFLPHASAKPLARLMLACSSFALSGTVSGRHRIEVAGLAVECGLALADAARVEADHVVLSGHLLRQRSGDEAGERQSAAAGAAGVDQQRALGLLRGVLDTRHGDGDLLAVGLGVVQGGFHRGALKLRVVLGPAVFPLQAGARGLGRTAGRALFAGRCRKCRDRPGQCQYGGAVNGYDTSLLHLCCSGCGGSTPHM